MILQNLRIYFLQVLKSFGKVRKFLDVRLRAHGGREEIEKGSGLGTRGEEGLGREEEKGIVMEKRIFIEEE